MGITDLAQRARPSRALLFAFVTTACMPFAQSPLPDKGPPPLSELVEPNPKIESRDLFYGVGGKEFAPRADVEYRFLEKDTSGFSLNYEIEDPQGRRYDTKFGVEARAEVIASRLLWAIGFYQPPVYYLPEWKIGGDVLEAGVQAPARFRYERPDWKKHGDWSWQDNKFVGTRELNGLVVMMIMMNNWDTKTSNNKIYERMNATPEKVYVVKDLGRSFGNSVRIFMGSQDDPEKFGREGFIKRVEGDEVEFNYKPILLNWGGTRGITVEDVLWTCKRLARLSDRQWHDAFRAGGLSPEEADAFVAIMRKKVADGLALEHAHAGRDS
jgi:hypothetical protein